MSPTIAAADELLASSFRTLGYTLGETTGVINGATVIDRAGRYLFAWHRQPRHLLFYLRPPALSAKSTLRQKAIHRHGDDVQRNSAGETTITLRSEADARTLLDWLLPTLPLP